MIEIIYFFVNSYSFWTQLFYLYLGKETPSLGPKSKMGAIRKRAEKNLESGLQTKV
jgi:hypothetical protein